MKLTPMTAGGSMPGQNISMNNKGASQSRIASAKAIAQGENPMSLKPSDTPIDPLVTKTEESIRRIKMRTNHSTDRMPSEEELKLALEQVNQEQTAQPETETATPSAILDESKQGVIEDTKPLAPQAAAIAKARRALQQERAAFEREKAELAGKSQGGDLTGFLERFKSQPLSVMQEQGVLNPEFYNQMTEYLVSGKGQIDPELAALRAELKSVKEDVTKTLSEREQQMENQAMYEMRREAEALLARDGDTFELVKAKGAVPEVMKLIHRTYKTTGEVLDIVDAMSLVEEQLLEDYSPLLQTKKIQSKFAPQQPSQQQLQPQQKQMKTLTNRDAAQPVLDRRTRAILAAQGLLKR